jgi:heptosyltransferase-2
MALPLIDHLLSSRRSLSITVIAPKAMVPMLMEKDGISEVIPYWKGCLSDDRLRSRHDAVMLLTNSFSSAWEAYRGGYPIRMGYAMHYRGWLLTHCLKPNKMIHHVERYLNLASLCGALAPEGRLVPVLGCQGGAITLQKFGLEASKYLVLAPGAAYGSAKAWPIDSFLQFIPLFLEHEWRGLKIVIVGDRSLEAYFEVCEGYPNVHVLLGKTNLLELAHILSNAAAYIGNDSGPSHLAAAVKTPSVVLFGPTDPTLSFPRGEGELHLLSNKVVCAPCHRRTCPIDHRCMRGITVDALYQLIRRILRSRGFGS